MSADDGIHHDHIGDMTLLGQHNYTQNGTLST